ncbi:kinase-like domain-containing protein [Gaertneriomyces semiglobifer]|nr:kinase-like domain-containing protein [Gaertneriomyces semiglobifer]
MGIACCKEEEIDFTQEVELNHFHLLRSVGKGAFGKVRVVQHKGNQQIYALKYINKAKCIKMRAVENIIQERRLLEEVECPFVCNLRYAFQDDENLFMVIDLMLGGDLRFHLDRMGTFKPEMVKFYIAEVACGLAYLHSRRIVHRDLKPDNVLLDAEGHAHLTDFNIAVHYREEKPLTAVAGSMAYMAPEILAKKGYFSSVDWWSLGVMAYELSFGKRPFRAKTNEALTQAILNDNLDFPSHAADTITADGVDTLKGLITRDIHKRLGSKESGGVERLQQHPWFKEFDWAELAQKKGTPPFVPDSKRANFDATHELEELLLEDNPLKAKPRKKRKEGEPIKVPEGQDPAVTKDMAIMEEKFTVYDFTKLKGPHTDQPYTGHCARMASLFN